MDHSPLSACYQVFSRFLQCCLCSVWTAYCVVISDSQYRRVALDIMQSLYHAQAWAFHSSLNFLGVWLHQQIVAFLSRKYSLAHSLPQLLSSNILFLSVLFSRCYPAPTFRKPKTATYQRTLSLIMPYRRMMSWSVNFNFWPASRVPCRLSLALYVNIGIFYFMK